MTDSELRRLEREFSRLGTTGAKTAWLRARLRAGDLERSRLEVAACCGDESAAELAGHDCQTSLSPCLRCWTEVRVLRLIASRGAPEVGVRIAIAGARRIQRLWREVHAASGWEGLSHLAWLHHAQRPSGQVLPGDWAGLNQTVEEAIAGAEEAVLAPAPRPCGDRALAAWMRLKAYPAPFNLRWAKLPIQLLSGPTGEPDWQGLTYGLAREVLYASIRAELVPWSLGYGDPVRERIEGRQ